jgi:hypothetical protein
MTPAHPLPATCGAAFKEWSGVCRALADGRQSLILRKGGIAEGPRGFVPEHEVFWLYPTHVHESEQGLRSPATGTPERPAPPDTVELGALAMTGPIGFVDRLETLKMLRDLHVWTDETVEKRFRYRKPGLWVLGVRVFRSPAPVALAVTPGHAGCKSWVPIDPPLETAGAVPVLDDEEFGRAMLRLRSTLNPKG